MPPASCRFRWCWSAGPRSGRPCRRRAPRSGCRERRGSPASAWASTAEAESLLPAALVARTSNSCRVTPLVKAGHFGVPVVASLLPAMSVQLSAAGLVSRLLLVAHVVLGDRPCPCRATGSQVRVTWVSPARGLPGCSGADGTLPGPASGVRLDAWPTAPRARGVHRADDRTVVVGAVDQARHVGTAPPCPSFARSTGSRAGSRPRPSSPCRRSSHRCRSGWCWWAGSTGHHHFAPSPGTVAVRLVGRTRRITSFGWAPAASPRRWRGRRCRRCWWRAPGRS